MFDVGFSELLLLAIVALVVLGPEKLPHVARIAGAWVARIRRTVSHMQSEIEREVMAQEFKARMDKELKAMGASQIVQELHAETQAIEAGFQEVHGSAHDSLSAVTAVTNAAGMKAPGSTSSLAEPATPLAQIEIDGEKAYREWLDAQKQNRILPPEKITSEPSVDQPRHE